MSRLAHSEALLGPELFKQIRETPVLVVGAGGIGCELLKNLVLVGFANIEIIDLDTIDLSNLNRQFLFRKPDISKSKSLVAAASARHFNPSSGINIHARHGNVKEAQNDLEWIKGFGLVMNALDNMDARRHVNRLCAAGGVPLMESGTAGYLGQVTTILRDETECFDCVQKQTPKSFPVCTIRATPSEPIHCIVWAKSYLFGKLFGEDDEAGDSAELDKAQASGENADEIANLKQEAAAFREVRQQLGDEEGPRKVFTKVFNDDINRLLSMEDMWTGPGRVKPVALDYDAIMDGSFVTPPLRTAAAAPSASTSNGEATIKGQTQGTSSSNGESSTSGTAAHSNGVANGQSGRQLKDQRELSVKENLELFVDSCRRLSARAIAQPDIILSFDKDDDDTLDFVLATANLRAIAYGIPNKTRFQVKEMAGNIIPAIATTNAIIAGLLVMQATRLLARNLAKAGPIHLKAIAATPLGRSNPIKPNPDCSICRDTYISLRTDPSKLTLGTFVEEIANKWLVQNLDTEEDVAWVIMEGSRILADPDFDDNHSKTLAEMGIERGKIITVRHEDELYRPVQFCLSALPDGSEEVYILPESPASLPLQPAKKEPEPESDDEIEAIDETTVIVAARASTLASKGKRRAPEEESGEETVKKRRVQEQSNGVIEID